MMNKVKKIYIVGIVLVLTIFVALLLYAQDSIYGLPPHIAIFPKADGTSTGEFRFLELFTNGSNYVAMKAPNSLPSNTLFVLPPTNGSSGQFLATDGNGVTSWSNPKEFNKWQYTYKVYSGDSSTIYSVYSTRAFPVTLTEVYCKSADPSFSLVFNLLRDDGSPAYVMPTTLNCNISGASSTAFNSGENVLSIGHTLTHQTASISGGGSVSAVYITLTFTIN
jgi:hypothetical protein